MRLVTRRGDGLLASALLAPWLALSCSFPDFVVATAGSAGGTGGVSAASGGSGESGGGGGGSGAFAGSSSGAEASTGGVSGAGGGGTGGAGTSGHSGEGGESAGASGAAGEGGGPDVGPCGPREGVAHCSSGQLDGDETDVDCGGASCASCAADEACAGRSDCASGTCTGGKCARTMDLAYVRQETSTETKTIHLRAQLTYLKPEPRPLRDLKVRYYFSRNAAVEPILATASATLQPGGDASADVTPVVVRQLRGDGLTNDAYLEIGFQGGKILTENQVVEIFAQISSGREGSLFNQLTHHSFDNESGLHETKKLSVHLAEQRVWGRGPNIDDPPSCLFRGVNLEGPALEVGGEDWLAGGPSPLPDYSNRALPLKPKTDQGREDMLRAGLYVADQRHLHPIPNGTYALSVYVWAADGTQTGTLQVQGRDLDTFRSFAADDGAAPWAALGPYRVTVADEQLSLGARGVLRIGGFELRYLDE
jgi:hypothetical protein